MTTDSISLAGISRWAGQTSTEGLCFLPNATNALWLSAAEDLHKFSDGAIVGSLNLRREEAARQLAEIFMVSDAITALPLTLAGLVGTYASLFVGIDTTFQLIRSLHSS